MGEYVEKRADEVQILSSNIRDLEYGAYSLADKLCLDAG